MDGERPAPEPERPARRWARSWTLRDALEAAITPERAAEIAEGLASKAAEGDVAAVRELRLSMFGDAPKFAEAEEQELRLKPGAITSIEDVAKATTATLRAVENGEMSPAAAARIMALLREARETFECREFSDEVRQALEKELRRQKSVGPHNP